MTTYLSIDVATKSLAIGIYRINKFSEHEIDKNIEPMLMNVYDLADGKTSKESMIDEKAKALKLVLDDVDTHLITPYTVLIEYQMNANYMSNAIFNMLIYHYACKAPIHTIKPSLKNSIYLHQKLKLSDFLATASSNYTANKNHCKYNFLYFMILFEHQDKIKHIKQKNYDDIADTFMQCLAFHKKSNLALP